MFCWPCISIYLCNKNQLDALFILSFFRQSTYTRFGHSCSPSAGGVLYIYTTVGTYCAVQLTVFCRIASTTYPANIQSTKKHKTYQLLYIYSILPDDGLKICPKHVEVDRRNKLRTNSASSWFYLQGNTFLTPYEKLQLFHSQYSGSVQMNLENGTT